MVEEGLVGLVATERDTNLLREGGAKGVIRRGGKSHIEGHVPDGQDDASTVQEGVLIVGGVGEDRAKARLQAALSDLGERKAISEVRKGIHVQRVLGWGVLQELLELACD